MFCFYPLTGVTLHTIPPIAGLQILVHLGTVGVNRVGWVMSFSENW
jgi:hypothetical protein